MREFFLPCPLLTYYINQHLRCYSKFSVSGLQGNEITSGLLPLILLDFSRGISAQLQNANK